MPTDGDSRTPEDATGTAGTSEPRTEQDSQATPRIPVDIVGGIALLGVVAVFLLNAGDNLLDWVFPLSLSYTLAVIAVYLVIRGLLGHGEKIATLLPILRGRGVDAFVFTVLAAVYVGLVRPVGFWIMSVLMLFTGSVYLDHSRSTRRVALAAVVAVAVCAVAYVLLVRVLHVPVPRARWLPF